MIGATVAHYKVVEKLGEGGMGVVYRALDTRLNRSVALKVLPSERTANIEHRTRFLREARAASALNHPNIITVHDAGEAGGVSYIAMELAEGSTLSGLIGRKSLSLADAISYAVQIADALATAHTAGIIHRDLKPGNIMVTGPGRVKVLDFGLAKVTRPVTADQSAVTMTLTPDQGPPTEEGTLLGTVAYMSPEQAEGKAVDARSDIFSFGAVLYEMVTGMRAFQGRTNASTLSAILREDPRPASELARGVPQELDKLIAHCLRKDPARRFQHLDDVKTLLEELKDDASRSKQNRGMRQRVVVGGATALVVALGVSALMLWPKTPSAPVETVPIRLTSDAGLTTDPALSADGKLLAFASDRSGGDQLDIWVKQVGGSEALRLTTHEADDHQPSLSPDGQRIAFRSERDGGGIYIMSTLGGDPRLIAREGRRPQFSPDGRWLAYWVGGIGADFAASGGSQVYIVSSGGGMPQQVTSNLVGTRYPVWSPDSTRLLLYGASEYKGVAAETDDWWVIPVTGGTAAKTGAFDVFRRRKLAADFTAVPSGWTSENVVVFASPFGDSTNVWQVPISASTHRISGDPQRLTGGTGLEGLPAAAGAGPSGMRRLAFASINENIDVWSVNFASGGGANTGRIGGDMQRLTQDTAPDVQPALSRDGKLLVFNSSRLGNPDIWTKDLESGRETVLAATPLSEWHAAISADRSTVAYQVIENQRDSIHVVVRGGQPRKLCDDCFLPWDLSSDGKHMLYWSIDQRHVGLIDVRSGTRTALLSHPTYAILRATFSPDNRWIAFTAIGQAVNPLNFIAPFAESGPLVERDWIALSDGTQFEEVARWSPDGSLMYFVSQRDGFECLWGLRLDPATKRPVGALFPVHHLHSARRSLGNVIVMFKEFGVSSDRLVFPLVERTGNIWMLER